MVGGRTVYLERRAAERLLPIRGVDTFIVRAAPEALRSVGTALAKFADDHGLMVHSFAELSGMLDGIMAGVLRGLWGLVVLAFVVAAFGIANTLTMNVWEQTREIALLRAVGMTPWQVRKMILAQAAILGAISLVTGMIAGVNTAYLISRTMWPLVGYPIAFSLHPWLLAGTFAAAMLIVLAAAWLPAERAARLDLLTALQYE
jgi:putative ABC transport system permease protein